MTTSVSTKLGSFGNEVIAETNPVTGGIASIQSGGADIPLTVMSRRTPSFILGRQISNSLSVAGPAGGTYTYHTTTTVERSATKFRVALHNLAATSCAGVTGCIAVSNALGADINYNNTTNKARFTPSTGTWVPLTWASSSSVTLPARVSATAPSITWSDWVDISTIARTDGGTLPVVMMRHTVPIGQAYSYGTYSAIGAAWQQSANTSVHAGRVWNNIKWVGDAVATPASMKDETDLGYPTIMGFEYVATKPGVTFATLGDSIMDGSVNGLSGNYGNGFIWQAVKLLREQFPNTPIELSSKSWAGQASSSYYSRLADIVTAGDNYDVLIYAPFSHNDGTPTQAKIDLEISRLGLLSNTLQSLGKGLILVTPFPNTASGWNAAADSFRTALRTAMLSYGAAFDVIDVESVGDGASPARFVPAYTTDNSHPNEAGHAVLAPIASAVMSKFVPK